jgi:leader peptidase (prepilin peptidase)/N-methyltransferase
MRYPAIEALTAVLFAVVALTADSAVELVSGLLLVAMVVAVAVIDAEHKIVPNRVLLPASLAAILIWGIGDPGKLPQHLLFGLAAGGLLLAVALAYPAGMGMGDVKLAGAMGLFLGRSVAPALLVGFAAGAVVGIGIMIAQGSAARKRAIPFAPYLAAGAIVGQLFGAELIDWYLGLS